MLMLCAADLAGRLTPELDQDARPPVVAYLLRRSPSLLAPLPKAQRAALAQLLEVHDYASGATVYAEGDEPSMQTPFFLLIEGHVELIKHDTAAGGDAHAGWRSADDECSWFGEGALQKYRPRSHTAICREPTKCLVVRAEQFERFLEQMPAEWVSAVTDGRVFRGRLSKALANVSASNGSDPYAIGLKKKMGLGRSAMLSSLQATVREGLSARAAAEEPLAAKRPPAEDVTGSE